MYRYGVTKSGSTEVLFAAIIRGSNANWPPTSNCQQNRSLPYSRAPLEGWRHRWVRLVLLEGPEGVQVGVLVVQPDDEAHRHQVVVSKVVQERTAVLCSLLRKGEVFMVVYRVTHQVLRLFISSR